MKAIDVLNVFHRLAVDQTEKSPRQQQNRDMGAQEADAFSELLASIFTKEEETEGEQTILPEALELEEALAAGLTAGYPLSQAAAGSPEEQKPTHERVWPMRSSLIANMLARLQEVTANPERSKIIESLSAEQRMALLRSVELVGQTFAAGALKHVEHVTADPDKLEQGFKQLIALLQQHETEQQATGKQTVSQQLEQLQQVVQHMNHLVQAPDSSAQTAESPKGNAQHGNTTPQTSGHIVSQHESQHLTGATIETKAGDTAQRVEVRTPPPFVRMSNLIDELSDVFRGSYRLNGTEAGTHIRVNIYPEHLGHLDIRLTALEGKIAAQILTHHPVVKEALDMQVYQLRNALNQQGITIDKIEITQQPSQQSFDQHHAHADQRFLQQQRKQGASSSRHQQGYPLAEADAVIGQGYVVGGSTVVDYII